MKHRALIGPQEVKWAVLCILVLLGGVAAVDTDSWDDPLRPGLLLLASTICLKLILEYLLRLPMTFLYVRLQPGARGARMRVAIASALLLALTIWGESKW